MSLELSRDFFDQNTLVVAKKLLGQTLVVGNNRAKIIETEGYRGRSDPASHAASGKTERNQLMFGLPGVVYIYLVYGMHYCLNFVTEKKDLPGAVLIRGVELEQNNQRILGPGRLTKHFGLDLSYNGIDSIGSKEIFVLNTQQSPLKYHKTPRIGISRGTDKLWRFCL